ncbi:hypothetical protein GQ457_10G007760 [Hibiscus cannabinus]
MTKFTCSSIVFLLLLVLLTIDMSPMAVEGKIKICERPSSKFKGLCMSRLDCETLCNSEGFTDGECEGFRRRCICKKPC